MNAHFPQTRPYDARWDYRIYSINPTEQIRALYQMRDDADDAYAFWTQQARCFTGSAKQGALMNADDALAKSEYAEAAIRQLGDG